METLPTSLWKEADLCEWWEEIVTRCINQKLINLLVAQPNFHNITVLSCQGFSLQTKHNSKMNDYPRPEVQVSQNHF